MVTWPILDQFYNFAPNKISSERLKLQTSDFVHGLITKSANFQMTNCRLSGRGQSHVTHSTISHTLKYLWNGWSKSRQILYACRLYQVSAFGRLTIPERGVARVTWSILEFYTLLNFCGMAEDRIVKFCARVDPRSISLVVINCPQAGVVVTWRRNFLANKC